MTFELVNGLVFGLEHLSYNDEESEDVSWIVILHIAMFRVMFYKLK